MNFSRHTTFPTLGSLFKDELFQAHRIFPFEGRFSTPENVPGAAHFPLGSLKFACPHSTVTQCRKRLYGTTQSIRNRAQRRPRTMTHFSIVYCYIGVAFLWWIIPGAQRFSTWGSLFYSVTVTRWIVSGTQKYSIWPSFFKDDELFQAHNAFPLEGRFSTRWVVSGTQKYSTWPTFFQRRWIVPGESSQAPREILHLRIVFLHDELFQTHKNIFTWGSFFKDDELFQSHNAFPLQGRFSTWWIVPGVHHVLRLRIVFLRDELFVARHVFHLGIVVHTVLRELFQAHNVFPLEDLYSTRWIVSATQKYPISGTFSKTMIHWIVPGTPRILNFTLGSFFNHSVIELSTKCFRHAPHISTAGSFFYTMNFSRRAPHIIIIALEDRFSARRIVPGTPHFPTLRSFFQDEFFTAPHILTAGSFFYTMNCFRRTKSST